MSKKKFLCVRFIYVKKNCLYENFCKKKLFTFFCKIDFFPKVIV